MRAVPGMTTECALASPTFLQAMSPAERKHLLEQLGGLERRRIDAAAGSDAKARLARGRKGKVQDEFKASDDGILLQELHQHKSALRALRAEADGLVRDNRALSTEVLHLRKVAASERENASALDNRVLQLQVLGTQHVSLTRENSTATTYRTLVHALYVDSFDTQNSLHLQQQASLNAKLDQLATPEVLAATQPPAEFPVPAPHTEPKSLGSVVSEINKLRKQLIQAQTLLARATKQCDGYRRKLSESQSKRKAEKAGYQREMAGMQSRLLGAMRRLVYVADKVAVKDATITERDAYINRLEQQLVTKPAPARHPSCKARTDTVKQDRQRPGRRCRSHGPAARSPSPSPHVRGMHGRLAGGSLCTREKASASSTPAVAPAAALRRPVSAWAGRSETSGYRQKHDLQSKARLASHSGPPPIAGSAEHTARRPSFGRLDVHSLVAATSVSPSVVAAGGSVSPESGFTGHASPNAGSSIDEEKAWDDYQDALDTMQRRIDAMGPILDAYDAPDVNETRVHLDTDLSIFDHGAHDSVKLEL